MQDDKRRVNDELMLALETNTEPEARLLSLDTLNNMGYISVDTLIDTVSSEEDPRVQLQAIDYLVKRIDEDPRIEEFLAAFFKSQPNVLSEHLLK